MSDRKIALATWLGGADFFRIDSVELERGVQQEVPAATARRLETEFPAQAEVVHCVAGSAQDVRKPAVVVPPQAEEEDADPEPEAPAAALEESDQHDSTPPDPSPKDKE